MLIFETRKFAESSYKRLRNPAKIYLIDTGICKKVTSADWGRMLENIVFCQLRRKSEEIFYFEEKRECDFIIKDEQGKFLKLAEDIKSLPQEILVKKEETFKLLEPITSELGINLRRVKKLKMLEEAQASMLKFTTKRF